MTQLIWILSLMIPMAVAQPDSDLRQAKRAHLAGDHSEAIELLKKNRVLSAEGLLILGNSYYLEERYREAENTYTRLAGKKGPLGTLGQIYRARARRKLERYRPALADLKRAQRMRLTATGRLVLRNERGYLKEDLFSKTFEHYRAGSYTQALAHSKLYLAQWPEARAYFLHGLTLHRLGRRAEARKYLSVISKKFPGEKQYISEAQALLKNKKNPRQVENSLALAAGYNSNILRQADASVDEQKPVAELAYDIRIPLTRSRKSRLSVDSHLYLEEVVSRPELRYLVLDTSLALKQNIGTFELTPIVGLGADLLGSRVILVRPFFGTRLGKRFARAEAWGEYTFGRILHLDDEFNYLGGFSHRLRLDYAAGSRLVWGVYAVARVEDSGDQLGSAGRFPIAYRGVGPGLNLTWNPSRDWRIRFDAQFMIRFHVKTELPSNNFRDDRRLTGYLDIRRRVSPDLALRFISRFAKNSSTLGPSSIVDMNYFQWSALFGIVVMNPLF